MEFTGIILLTVGCMCVFVMHKHSQYKKNEMYRLQIMDYEMRKFMNQAIHDFDKKR